MALNKCELMSFRSDFKVDLHECVVIITALLSSFLLIPLLSLSSDLPNSLVEKPRIYVICIGHKDCSHCKRWQSTVLPQMYKFGWKPEEITYSEFPSEKPSVPLVPLYLRFVNDRLTTYVNSAMNFDQTVEFYNTGKVQVNK
jgi:hypothetical protein